MEISFEERDSKSQSSQNGNFLVVAFLFTSAVMGKRGRKKMERGRRELCKGYEWVGWGGVGGGTLMSAGVTAPESMLMKRRAQTGNQ